MFLNRLPTNTVFNLNGNFYKVIKRVHNDGVNYGYLVQKMVVLNGEYANANCPLQLLPLVELTLQPVSNLSEVTVLVYA